MVVEDHEKTQAVKHKPSAGEYLQVRVGNRLQSLVDRAVDSLLPGEEAHVLMSMWGSRPLHFLPHCFRRDHTGDTDAEYAAKTAAFWV